MPVIARYLTMALHFGPRASCDASSVAPAHRLLVSLPHDRCRARLGLGVWAVALTSAAHAGRVALFWPA
jgi:hypothetical protein